MAKEKLKPVKGVAGLFVNPRGQYVIRTTALSEKTGKLGERSKTLKPGTTKDIALRELADLREKLRSGESDQPARQAPTLEAYAPLFAQRRLSRGKWSANGGTAEITGWRLDRYVIPVLGDYLLDRITYGDLQAWLDGMAARGLSARTIRAVYGNLRSLIRDGRRDYGLQPLPAFPDPPAAPKAAKTELTWENFDQGQAALTREQLALFLEASKQESPHGWYPFVVLGFASGARFSELAAVEVQDLNLSGDVGIWLCRRHLIASRGESAPGVKWDPKGEVKLLDTTSTQILRPFLIGREPTELLFRSDQPHYEFRSNKGLQWFFDVICAKTKLPRVTSKIFRQTYLTLSHLESMADAMSQAQAGHTDARTTGAYIKPSVEARKQHAKRMGGVLYAVPEPDRSDE